ncbi:MAG: tetratricopeptide repeat protein [Candidatus Latescibacteria bacterium]|nr:tetratricopeptide repeat protein [Candidatus Latescibacterota bacterium]
MKQLFPFSDTHRTWLAYIGLVALLAAICFGNLREYSFDSDDDTYIRDSAEISKDFSNLLFPSRYPGRPLVNLVFWAGYTLWGEFPGAFHLLVVGAHLLCALLLPLLVVGLGSSLELGLLSGLLFLINVAHFRAVQWISAISYPLMLALGVAAVLCCLRYMASRQTKFLAATYGALLLAVLAHPAAVALWLFCVYLSWSTEGRLQGTALRLLPLGVLLLGIVGSVVYLYPGSPPVAIAARLPDPLESGQNLLWFLSRLLVSAHWILWPIHQLATWELWVGLAGLAGLAAVIWRSQPPMVYWAVWTLVTLLPFITPPPAVLSDLPQGGPSRFLYLASAGTAVLGAWGLLQLAGWVQGKAGPRWGRVILAGLTAALAVSSFFALKKVEAFTLYTTGRNSIATGSELGIAQLKRAVATRSRVIPLEDAYVRLCLHLLGTAEFEPYLAEALQQFPTNSNLNIFKQVAASMGPDPGARQQATLRLEKVLALTSGAQRQDVAVLAAQSYSNMALNFHRGGDLGAAISAYRQALIFDAADHVAHSNLGTALKQVGRLPEAFQAYQQAVQLQPHNPILYHNLGALAQEQGDWQKGIAAFERAVQLGSDNVETYLGLSQLYQENGQLDEALRVYSQIIEKDLRGGSSFLYTKMGADLFHLGRRDESTTAYRKALAKDANNLVAHVNLGRNLYLKGEVPEAITHYQQALAVQPSSQAQFRLGLAYLRLGQVARARQAYAEGIERFGAAEAERIGAVEDLKQLIGQGIQVVETQQILSTYWK